MIRPLDNLNLGVSIFYTLLATASALPSGIWVVNIDNNPAPSPEDGPPLSSGAIRDSAYLPVQIGSIVGAYLVWIVFISIAILTVGRRLRRQAQTSLRSLQMEIIHPNANLVPMHQHQPGAEAKETAATGIWEVTPTSPIKEKPWSIKSWGSTKKHSRSAAGSVVTFDDSVINDDRARNEMEMDRLYAAVAAHEARRHTPASSPPMPSTSTMPPLSPTSPTMPMSPLNQNPPELQHLRYPGKNAYHDSGLLPSPPPEHEGERSPTSPDSPKSSKSISKRVNKPTPLNFNNPPSRDSSRSSFSSFASFGRKKSSSVRGLPISPPIGSSQMSHDNQYSDTTPLTPRLYKPGPPPPTPPVQYKPSQQEPLASPLSFDDDGRKYYFSPGIRSSRASMSTQGYSPGPTPRTATFPIYPPPSVQEEQYQVAQQTHLGSHTIPITIQPSSAAATPRTVPSTPFPTQEAHHQPTLHNNYSVPRINPPPRTGSASTDSSRRPKPAPLSLQSSGVSNNSQTTLPLRTAPLPLRALRSPNSTRPISTIKNTELSRPEPQARKGGLMVPSTAGMVPATPYSPFYMPMTPLTPMTPSRLVTREERRRHKKEEGRRVLTQDDMVVSEEDMWGEGY